MVVIGTNERHCNLLFLNTLHLVTGYYTYPDHTPTPPNDR
jgi:hypothetical protein